MSTLELKKNIIEKIQLTSDIHLLELIDGILSQDNADGFVLTENQKGLIELSRQQIKDGLLFTNDEVSQETERWLSK